MLAINIVIATVIIILIIIIYYWNTIMINIICIAIVKRGILAPNEFWWGVTDSLHDSTGVELFYKIKEDYPQFYQTNILGKPIVSVLDINTVKEILDNSPDVFTVGTFKYNFFKSFMSKNVGVLSGDEWINLRRINEDVLDTGNTHQYSTTFNEIINASLLDLLPTDFDDFNISAKNITEMIIFGNNHPDQNYIYDAITEANKLPIFTPSKVNSYIKSQIYINDSLRNPMANTLINSLGQYTTGPWQNYLNDQVYHFVFPMVSLITIHVPRILALIITHSEVKNKLLQLINQNDSAYLRKCIMETLRLNSPVVSFFRKSTQNALGFPMETDFLILTNPILRDPKIFTNPNQFEPDRWTHELMISRYNIIFGLGPQRCPGKDLSLNILQNYLTNYISSIDMTKLRVVNDDVLFMDRPRVSYAINPYKIKFTMD